MRSAKGFPSRSLVRKRTSTFLVDSILADRFASRNLRLIGIEATEANKSLERMPAYIDALRSAGAKRNTHIVAVGGGIIQDIATFVASVYMRGLPWTYLPTTVLGMVDSCIGGKSSINVLGHKNLAGNFYPPRRILIDTGFVSTLSVEMAVGGLFEAAKICYAYSGERFESYLALSPETARTPEAVQPVVSLALRTKKWFIETDEFDQNERLLLNFGHTFGHAAEAATDFGISHGVAVGLGMLIACRFAEHQQLLSQTGTDLATKLCDHVRKMLVVLDEADTFIKTPIPVREAMEKFEYDKKHKPDEFRIAVPVEHGALKLISIPRDETARRDLASTYETVLQTIGWPCL